MEMNFDRLFRFCHTFLVIYFNIPNFCFFFFHLLPSILLLTFIFAYKRKSDLKLSHTKATNFFNLKMTSFEFQFSSRYYSTPDNKIATKK